VRGSDRGGGLKGLIAAARLPLLRNLVSPRQQLGEPALDAGTRIEPSRDFKVPSQHSPVATAEDIFYCFRLLLARCPNPEEWPGHSSRAGEDLENVVGSFVNSREFAERGMARKTYDEKVEVARFPEYALFASPDDLAVGKHALNGHPFDPGIGAVYRRYLKPGMGVLDVGANIGSLVMLAAALVGSAGCVIAVEPNPDNVRLLEASRRLNRFDQIQVLQLAAGHETALLSLNVSFSNGVTGDLPKDLQTLLAARSVQCIALDKVLPPQRRIDLLKLDVEGAELNALRGMPELLARDRPIIVSEFSPGSLPGISHCTGPEYLAFLIAGGYRLGVIEKDGSETPCGTDIDAVMTAFARSGIDHIDLVAAVI